MYDVVELFIMPDYTTPAEGKGRPLLRYTFGEAKLSGGCNGEGTWHVGSRMEGFDDRIVESPPMDDSEVRDDVMMKGIIVFRRNEENSAVDNDQINESSDDKSPDIETDERGKDTLEENSLPVVRKRGEKPSWYWKWILFILLILFICVFSYLFFLLFNRNDKDDMENANEVLMVELRMNITLAKQEELIVAQKEEQEVIKGELKTMNTTLNLQKEEDIKLFNLVNILNSSLGRQGDEHDALERRLWKVNATNIRQEVDLKSLKDNINSNEVLTEVNVTVPEGQCVSRGDVVGYFRGEMVSSHPHVPFARLSTSLTPFLLKQNKFILTYGDNAHSEYGTAIVGDISGCDISFGYKFIFNSAPTPPLYISSVSLSETKFVVTYQDGGNYGYGTATIGSVDGSEISFGPDFVFNAAMTSPISSIALNETKFVISFGEVGYGIAIVGSVDGNEISFGSEFVFTTESLSFVCCVSLNDTTFVVTYRRSYGAVIVGVVSNNDISFGPEVLINAGPAISLGQTKIAVTYEKSAFVGTVSGSCISFGSAFIFSTASFINYVSFASLNEAKFVVAYRDGGREYYGTAIIGSVNGSVIAFGSEFLFNMADTRSISPVRLDENKIVVFYYDYYHSKRGTAIVGHVNGNEILFGGLNSVVANDGCEGDIVRLILFGLCTDCFSDLIPSYPTYFGSNGMLFSGKYGNNEHSKENYIGLAISRTSLFVNFPYSSLPVTPR